MSKKNRKHESVETTETFEQPAAVVEAAPVDEATLALAKIDEKEKVFTAEIDRLTLLLSEQKTKLRKLHQLKKQLHAVLGIAEAPAEPVAATE